MASPLPACRPAAYPAHPDPADRRSLGLRRRVRRQLNKGESLHALRRALFFAHQGHVRRRHLDNQVDQALCLTLSPTSRCYERRRISATPSTPCVPTATP
ncbi:MAG: Tn3 family transposase [Nocardioidaceae bacterium]